MSKVNSDGYINIQGWMVSDLGLKGNELLIYAIIYGFSQDKESKFTGSRQYLADWTNTTVKNVQNVLNSLVSKGLLTKEEKTINNIKLCEYKAIRIEKSLEEKKVPRGRKKFTGVEKNFPEGREKSSPNKLINNLEYKLDTTKQDNITKIDQDQSEVENSSSSLSEEIKEIKKYLLDEIQDIPTCKNIMFLVENRGLRLDRIKQVVEYAHKNQNGLGYIYKALEGGWKLEVNTTGESDDRDYKRGHKVNVEAMNSTVKAEEEKNQYVDKIDRLEAIYKGLDSLEKEKIDQEAYDKAVKDYGSTIAKIMVRTKTKFEILEKYYLMNKGA